jgi:hypothetical protein
VITFRSGFAPLDWMGEKVFGKGAKGHTAIAAAGLVYSFDERGWVMEGVQADYMARNTHRDGIGQVLKVKPEDAAGIQRGLNRSIGTGTYLFDGRVCTDATAQSLLDALGKLNGHHNPQRFADDLAASGNVERTITYAKAK